MTFLSFISDEQIIAITTSLIQTLERAITTKELDRNKIDPFSALFMMGYYGMSQEVWSINEKTRQTQKSLENAIGDFHQRVLGSMPGWEDLGKGNLIDLQNRELKLCAEVKNKYNTVKGSDRKGIYDNLANFLQTHPDFTAYYVEIIPEGASPYNKPFTPPDNTQPGKRRAANEYIRIIDGYSFYGLAAQKPGALKELYLALPNVIALIKKQKPQLFPKQDSIREKAELFFSESLFRKAYPWVD